MAVIGIGTDIVEVTRIKKLFKKYPEGFTKRILHENELSILENHPSPVTFISKRFAAKEALAKALGTGIANGVSFQDIEIANNKSGQPLLMLHAKTQKIATELGVKKLFISLSDEKKYAIAYVMLEG